MKPNQLEFIEKVSKLMDSRFRVPGTNFRFGLDPIIGLFPIIGDFIAFMISAMLVMTMTKYGVSRKVIILMTLNILFDALLGSVPIIGQIFDFFYKANDINIGILKKHYEEGKYMGSGRGILLLVFTLAILVFIFIIWVIYLIISHVFNLLTS